MFAAILGVLALVGALSACGSGHRGRSPSTLPGGLWVDTPVTFQAGGMTVYGTYRHPDGSGSVPAALLIAGSGPTDRDGNSKAIPGTVDTLRTLADWLSTDGVASLRYDKLGTGQTGLGPFQSRIDSITPTPFEQESLAALGFLAAQREVDRRRVLVFGHSEGALYALLLASQGSGLPPVAGLGLIEPASLRYLDALDEQHTKILAAEQQSGQLTADQAAQDRADLTNTIASLRSAGTIPTGLPPDLAALFNPTSRRYLTEVDRLDPATLAARLPAGLPVLLSCSNADIQIGCADVDHVAAGLAQAHTAIDYVHLDGVDHVLKQDPSRSGSNYGQPLPFSTQLRSRLAGFLTTHGL